MMKKRLLFVVFAIFCFLSSFSQSQLSLSDYEREELEGYEFIGNIDYLLVMEGSNLIITNSDWDVYLYGKLFGNTYIFKIFVKGTGISGDKSIRTLTINGDKYVQRADYDSDREIYTYPDVDISNYKYRAKVVSSVNNYVYIIYLNLPF